MPGKKGELWRSCVPRSSTNSGTSNSHVAPLLLFPSVSLLLYLSSSSTNGCIKELDSDSPYHSALFTMLSAGFSGLANVSMKYNSVGFYQMAKIAVTPSIVLAEFIGFKQRVSFLKKNQREMLHRHEIFDFFVRKDVRKILKRKDSDAGQKGRALEELRSSFFNKFRDQQRSCSPVVALSFNFIVAVSIIFINKWVFQGAGFRFPISLSFIHYAVSWVLMAILKTFSFLPPSPSSKSTPLSLFTLGFVMSLSTGLANVSLKYNSVGFYQMAKIAVTPSIVLAEFIWFKKRVSFLKVVALTFVSIGVAVATVTDLQFSAFGACIALAWIIPSAVNKILWSTLQQRDNWTALALMWKTTPITLFFLLTLIPFLDPPGVFSYEWNFSNTSLILTSAFLGFLLQWSGALALGALCFSKKEELF